MVEKFLSLDFIFIYLLYILFIYLSSLKFLWCHVAYLKFSTGSKHYANYMGTHLGNLANNSSEFELKYTLGQGAL
jgi:hypothetical protein